VRRFLNMNATELGASRAGHCSEEPRSQARVGAECTHRGRLRHVRNRQGDFTLIGRQPPSEELGAAVTLTYGDAGLVCYRGIALRLSSTRFN